jgi:glyoxylase-like metal-dependent hydrolase (beta-lactamase superfamily II)
MTQRMTAKSSLPSYTVLERGWLSSNNVLFPFGRRTAVVDTGYSSHADQTLFLIESGLANRDLDLICNTHLHSDHCGGNAKLQSHYPHVLTLIPPGHANEVTNWDEEALSYAPTGQACPRFAHHGLLEPGKTVLLGDHDWEIHAAPGHDPHSVILYEPESRTLISADALWENGFGVIFPVLDGIDAFDVVSETLDLIEYLSPITIIPGHGKVFHHLPGAIALARSRLDQFAQAPIKHARYAAKVLLKYKLLEWQVCERVQLRSWFTQTRYFSVLHQRFFELESMDVWFDTLLHDLVKSRSAQINGLLVRNCD